MKMKFTPKNYAKIGIIAAAVVAITGAGFLGIRAFSNAAVSRNLAEALAGVSTDSVNAADIRIAVLRMDAIQQSARVLEDLRNQRERFDNNLRTELERTQRELEREREEIERSQDVLSREALQRRVMEYQQKVANFQRSVQERAHAIEVAFQNSLVEIQTRHLDPVVNGIMGRKNITIVLDGRFVRLGENVPAALDITDEVITALDRKVTRFQMDRPAGL